MNSIEDTSEQNGIDLKTNFGEAVFISCSEGAPTSIDALEKIGIDSADDKGTVIKKIRAVLNSDERMKALATKLSRESSEGGLVTLSSNLESAIEEPEEIAKELLHQKAMISEDEADFSALGRSGVENIIITHYRDQLTNLLNLITQ